MGADMADLTGDGRPEIYVTDMLPEDDRRLKLTSAYEGYNLYQAKVANDYHHQVMRNTLQRSNGDGTFSEVGQIAGVSATDWSWGALFAGLLKLPENLFMVLPGTFAIILYSNMDLSNLNYTLNDGSICRVLKDCPNMTYPVLLFDLLPAGMLGLVLAGLLAAMMSSVSATFNSASTLITMDFVRKARPNLTSDQLVRIGQIATLVLVVLASLWAPQIERFGSLFRYLQLVLAFICPPVVAVFILGLFWRRANSEGSFYSLLVGFFIALGILFNEAYGWSPAVTEIHFLHKAFYLFVICALVHIFISIATPEPEATFQRAATTDDVIDLEDVTREGQLIEDRLDRYIWTSDIFTRETEELKSVVWYKNYRILAIGLLILTALLVGSFW